MDAIPVMALSWPMNSMILSRFSQRRLMGMIAMRRMRTMRWRERDRRSQFLEP